MTSVVQALTVTGLVIFMSFSGISDTGSESDSREQLRQREAEEKNNISRGN